MFRLIALITTLFAAAAGQCSVCGEGREVGNPDAIFLFQGQPDAPCGDLQEAGVDGTITATQCPFLPTLISDICECRPIQTPGPVAPPTTVSPTMTATMDPSSTPSVVAPTTSAPVSSAPVVPPTTSSPTVAATMDDTTLVTSSPSMVDATPGTRSEPTSGVSSVKSFLAAALAALSLAFL